MQERRQDFEWGGALRILTRVKRANFFFAPDPNWQIDGGSEGQVGR